MEMLENIRRLAESVMDKHGPLGLAALALFLLVVGLLWLRWRRGADAPAAAEAQV